MQRGVRSGGSVPGGVRLTSATVIAAAAVLAAQAFAQPHPPAPPPAPRASASSSAGAAPAPPPAIATHAERGAILAVASVVAQGLGKVSGRVLVAAGAPVSDAAAPKGAALAVAIASQVAGRRGGGAHVLPQPTPVGAARASVHGESALVYLSNRDRRRRASGHRRRVSGAGERLGSSA